jgi:flagellar biosynthesis/type III secretory pathway protein FliH
MTESHPSASADLAAAARRFDGALSRLEQVLASAVADVAELARRTGYADGHAAGLAEGRVQVALPPEPAGVAPGSTLEDELARAALEQRTAELEQAVAQARAALDAAIDDIRGALGQV